MSFSGDFLLVVVGKFHNITLALLSGMSVVLVDRLFPFLEDATRLMVPFFFCDAMDFSTAGGGSI